MEVKPGYKQTEVGVIPEEWETRPCSEVSERIMVGIVIRPTQYYVNNGVPAFRSANIREDGINDLDLVFISDESNAVLAKSQTRTGDVLTVRTGYPGTSAVVHSRHEGCNCIDILITRPSKKLDSEWLAIWINSPFGKEQVLRNQGGLAQKHFNVGDMRNLVVALPPLPEQRAIAAALSDVDGLLGGLDRLIAKKRDLKQAAMQQLLTGQTRLPGFNGKWEVKRLGEICRITTGKKDVNEGNPNGQFPFFTCSRSHTYSDSYSFDTEAILIAGNGEVGNLHYFKGKFEAYQRTYILSEFTAHIRYLWQQLNARLADALGLGKIGSSIPYIKKENLVDFEFNSPLDTAEQVAIAGVLTEMDGELAALEQRREKTRVLKQAMMQELLTGRTRLV